VSTNRKPFVYDQLVACHQSGSDDCTALVVTRDAGSDSGIVVVRKSHVVIWL
jgi:hypothetical protein